MWEASDQGGRGWGWGEGLPSGVARFVLADEERGRLYVGTDQGLAVLEPRVGRAQALLTPWQSAPDPALDLEARLGRGRLAGPAALSSRDGTVIFQLRAESVLEQTHARAVILELRDGRLTEWLPPEDLPLVELHDIEFDSAAGCWLLTGLALGGGEPQAAVLRRCGRESRGRRLGTLEVAGRVVRPIRVVAVAPRPDTGGIALAAELEVSEDGQRASGMGLFALDRDLADLEPLAAISEAFGERVSDLLWDPERGTVLVATRGRSLLELRQGRLAPFPVELPLDVQALQHHAASGSLLVATADGAFEVDQARRRVRFLGPEDRGDLPADSTPVGVAADGRVLLSSYEGGLSLVEATAGKPRVERLRPGAELPQGLYGAAVAFAGGVAAIVHGQGVAWRSGERVRLLEPAGGLAGPEVLHLLSRASELWIAHRPAPFGANRGGAIQTWDGTGFEPVVPGDALPGAVADWVVVPERDSVFAATRAGVIELRPDGRVERLSRSAVAALAREPGSGAIGAAGSTLERWDGERFRPVLFQLPHTGDAAGPRHAGAPLDLAIDRAGNWYLLFPHGFLVVLGEDGAARGALGPADGVPPSARALLVHPATGELWIGSAAEGVTVLGAGRRS